MRRRIAIVAWAALSALTLRSQPHTNGVALAYFAPENQLFYRMRYADGGYREFQRSLDDLSRMDGAGGWRVWLTGDGGAVVSGRGKEGRERYVFENGRLVSCTLPGGSQSFAYEDERVPPDDAVPPFLFGSIQEKAWHSASFAKTPKSANKLLKGKWNKSGRLRWPFDNPNENGFLYASLALLSLYLTMFRRRWFVIAGCLLSIAFLAPLVQTASRGAYLALAVGLAPSAILHFRLLVKSRWTYIALAVVLALAGAWFATHGGTRLLTRGFHGKSSWSNETRLDMWRMAPPMMVDAPDGWKINAGKAYLDWYEDCSCFTAPGSLINDHLAKMVRMGWPARFAYVFAWSTIFLGLALCARKTRDGVAAGMVAASAVAAWFNPLMINKWLWIAPLASLVPPLFVERVWRHWRQWAIAAAVGVVLASAAMGTIVFLAGRTPRPYGVTVRVDGRRVAVRGLNPRIWVVDDGLSLGGAFACKELRAALATNPEAASVGYVRYSDDLPRKGVDRLVLGGAAGDEWLTAVSGSPELQQNIPSEVVFISPPFPPSAIPPALFEAARVKYVTGEFNARYEREFDKPEPFVEIVPGMELYLSGWMRYAINP